MKFDLKLLNTVQGKKLEEFVQVPAGGNTVHNSTVKSHRASLEESAQRKFDEVHLAWRQRLGIQDEASSKKLIKALPEMVKKLAAQTAQKETLDEEVAVLADQVNAGRLLVEAAGEDKK